MEISVQEQVEKDLDRGELEEFDIEVKKLLSDLKKSERKCSPTQLCGVLLKEVKFQRAKVEKLTAAQAEVRQSNDRGGRPERNVINIEFKKNPDAQRFFINVGEFDGIDKSTLMDFIVENVTTVSRDDFSDSYTKDKFSFFELPKDKADDVMSLMNAGISRNGREVHVELSEHRRDSRGGGSRGGFSRGGDRGGRPSFGGRDRRPSYGDRRPSYGDRDRRPSFGGDRDRRPSFGGDRDRRPSFGGDRGGRPSYGGDRGGRSSYSRDSKPQPRYRDYSDEKK